jgi:exosome complex component CSL4
MDKIFVQRKTANKIPFFGIKYYLLNKKRREKMNEKLKIITPGETITTEEEYAPGKNTYAEKGSIKASTMGIIEYDDANKEARIKGKSIEELVPGDIITGQVNLVKESMATIELLSAENGKKITGVRTAQLPIRNISTEYVSEIRKIIKIGDIIRARITMSSPLAIDLATNEKGLGVIKAYCSNCRKEMHYSNEKLMCLECGSVEERKWFEAEQKPREFQPRGEGGFNGNGRGFGNRGGFRPRFGGNRGRSFGNRRGFDGRNRGFRGNGNREFGEKSQGYGGSEREGEFSGERRFGENRFGENNERRHSRGFGGNRGHSGENRGGFRREKHFQGNRRRF